MGAYLSEPLTDKVSTDLNGDRLNYGASSMQGWRVSQEDAHNCIIEFDKDTSLFAVYDGHGGHEVALYTSQKLPDFIKETEAYKNGDVEKALIDAFLSFDSTIATREVVAVLKELAGSKENEDSENESEDEENVSNLKEEASMPIEQVIEKYQTGVNPNLKKLQGEMPCSPFLRARKSMDNEAGSSSACGSSSNISAGSSSGNLAGASSTMTPGTTSTNSAGSSSNSIERTSSGYVSAPCSSALTSSTAAALKCDTSSDLNIVSSSNSEVTASSSAGNGSADATSTQTNHIAENAEVTSATTIKEDISPDSSNIVEKESAVEAETKEVKDEKECKAEMNGELPVSTVKGEDLCSSTTTQENGEVGNSSPKSKGKGKAVKKISDTQKKIRARTLRIRNARHLYTKLFDMEESDSEDENDETFEGGEEHSSSEVENDVGSSDDADDENASEESADEEDEVDIDDEDDEFARNIREEPGSDSGCTAVVAVVRGDKIYVANAGDSRCIICREGQAIEMSFDHKPEDNPEMKRITKAGGKVTLDGRVNGGLNLSRAIGDHAYKQNKELSDREQMITALPDVKIHQIDSKDEFMVLACDGIWNFMSSQEVVEFVQPRLAENMKLSTICEEMFDHCLAPNTMGDGTGCDNMTAIIVQFKKNNSKRCASPIDESESKRVKVDGN